MKRRTCVIALLPLLLLRVPEARAALPEVTLLVELRWVDSQLAPAATAGVRDGAVVVGTAGAVSPRGPGVVTGTAAPAAPPPQRLIVRNGERAALRLSAREPLQWVDMLAETGPQGQLRSVLVNPLPRERQVMRHLAITPTWAGGRAPARVVMQVEDDGLAFESTLDLPLSRWQTVARTGSVGAPASRGTVSSADAAGQPERELQLRVSVQPQP
ncbi:MAG: hypothetical protein K9J82_09685 [Methylotenera sp.]|jgi:hypothetical protein|nr:hypothetical protein [Methylotenera sp.]